MTRIAQTIQLFRLALISAALAGALGLALAQGGGTSAPPAAGTTLIDPLQLQDGTIRTLPRLPRVGAWGLVPGAPGSGDGNYGIHIDKPGQGVLYPTSMLLAPTAGTIEFALKLPDTHEPAGAQARILLDSWAATGPSRLQVVLQGGKLTLTWTDDGGQAKTVQGAANWAARSIHKIAVVWDAADISLYADGISIGAAEGARLFVREPLGIALGTNREMNAPSGVAVSSLRLSTAREPIAPANLQRLQDNIPNEELSLKMAQGYDRRLYPLFERLRQQNLQEVTFAYALAYADIGDTPRAMQAVTPIANDPRHPLHVQAIFLRADMLTDQKDFTGAYEQLQALATNPDKAVCIRAQVKQAEVLYEQGNKAEAIRLIGDIIARYTDLPYINDAYLVVGMEKFRAGSFQDAFSAFNFIGIPGAPPRQSVAIGKSFEIKVADADLNVRIADLGLPIVVEADNGDKEEVILKPAFSRGVYLGSVETALGAPQPGDHVLQVRGNDKIRLRYIDRLSNEGANVERVVALELASDAHLMTLAQSGMAVYREALDYQKKNILDDRWEVVGTLPKTASKFFRNAQDGSLAKKGMRFNFGFLGQIKAGQSFYVELADPDLDVTAEADTAQVELSTTGGKKTTVTLTETGARTGIFTTTVKTTLEGEPKEGALEVKKNDTITTRYVDPRPAAGTRDPVYLSRMTIQMTTDGTIACEREIAAPTNEEKDRKLLVSAVRVSNGSAVFVVVNDRDLDVTEGRDKVTVTVNSASGGTLEVTLPEVDDTPGSFAGAFRVATPEAKVPADLPVLSVKPGDLVTASYTDDENRQNAPTPREATFRVNVAEGAAISLARQIVEAVPVPEGKAPAVQPPPKVHWETTDIMVPGSMYRVTVVDGDVVPTRSDQLMSKVQVKAANGATVDVPLRGAMDAKEFTTVFTGEFFVRLGDAAGPTRAYFSQTGGGSLSLIDMREDEDVSSNTLWSVPAINVQGKDTVAVTYIEPLTAAFKTNQPMVVNLRVVGDAALAVMNAKGNPLADLKPGMAFDLQVSDPNGDVSPKADTIKVLLTSTANDRLEAVLTETDMHSGLFAATIATAYADKGIPANAVLEVPFDGSITIAYRDEETIAGTPQDRTAALTTRPLMDADGLLLTKVYDDPKFEVETLVRLGESLYAVGAAELATAGAPTGEGRTNAKLQESARLLQQVIDRFPTSQYVVESLYLTGKIRREEKSPDAEKLFTRVIEEYPDSEFVPQALYQLVLLYYDQDDIERATEAGMRLVYGFSKNPLVADAVLRIAEYYYNKKKDYLAAAFIYRRLIERFPDNPRVDLIKYRQATAYYRAGLAGDPSGLNNAVRHYLEFVEQYKDHELADDALYWAANAYMKQNNVRKAFTMLTKLLITYPTSDMVQQGYAGRLRDKIKDDYPNITAEAF